MFGIQLICNAKERSSSVKDQKKTKATVVKATAPKTEECEDSSCKDSQKSDKGTSENCKDCDNKSCGTYETCSDFCDEDGEPINCENKELCELVKKVNAHMCGCGNTCTLETLYKDYQSNECKCIPSIDTIPELKKPLEKILKRMEKAKPQEKTKLCKTVSYLVRTVYLCKQTEINNHKTGGFNDLVTEIIALFTNKSDHSTMAVTLFRILDLYVKIIKLAGKKYQNGEVNNLMHSLKNIINKANVQNNTKQLSKSLMGVYKLLRKILKVVGKVKTAEGATKHQQKMCTYILNILNDMIVTDTIPEFNLKIHGMKKIMNALIKYFDSIHILA